MLRRSLKKLARKSNLSNRFDGQQYCCPVWLEAKPDIKKILISGLPSDTTAGGKFGRVMHTHAVSHGW
jgi:hypothetical protein